ncbi:MAG: glycosyltransferase family 4 protein [Firmicutes bacterium]|nr:glycosyltransferase family 4 protein [Bacillota bacterium]
MTGQSIEMYCNSFLSATEPYLRCIDELMLETAVNLYDMYAGAARTATVNIAGIDPELRVAICDRQDLLLERIIDLLPQMTYDKHSIFTPAIHHHIGWENVDLMKDCGLAGYMLAKETGGRPVMYYGTQPADYPYLRYLPGMEILYNNTADDIYNVYFQHLNESYAEMDTLILYGMRVQQSFTYLNEYRKLQPQGKVYCGLDMNSFWMERIVWDNVLVKRFMAQCDLIATSCRSIRDALNRNPSVNFPCHWLANGFFNPTGHATNADTEQKENIILTVGRIGTGIKNNGELINAFSMIANILPDWQVRLVGSVEPEFQNDLEYFFTAYPDLRRRIILTGPIADKSELYKEYARAKIFVLTSLCEGGTPNVYAEALHHGCMFITSDIDAADDITNHGLLGIKYRLGDQQALANALVSLGQKADVHALQRHIPMALKYAAKYFDWQRNAKKLAFMLYR